jgi:CRP-like cAMP-binding protein
MFGSTEGMILIENRILAALPRKEHERLSPHLELVTLKPGQVLCDSGKTIRYAYFMDTAMASLLSLEGNTTIAVSLVGNEGMVGVPIFLRARSLPYQTTVRVAGIARRMKAGLLQAEFNQSGPLRILLLRYLHALVVQLSQSSVCNRFHSIKQRLCRWLLSSHDRVQSDDLQFTHELLSHLLGTNRTSVTEAASTLQKLGLIHYRRGQLTDRSGLEMAACPCYRIVKQEFDRFFSA